MNFRIDRGMTTHEGIDPVVRQQIQNLTKLKKDVLGLNEDRKQFIPKYIALTGLMTKVVEDLMLIYDNLKEAHPDDLFPRYRNLKTDFGNYIDKRIKHLQGVDVENDPPDLWWTSFKATKNPQYLSASNHIQDVLFALRSLSTHKFASSSTTLPQDIKELERDLENYCALLKGNDQLGLTREGFDSFKLQILADFHEIQTVCHGDAGFIDTEQIKLLVAKFERDLQVIRHASE